MSRQPHDRETSFDYQFTKRGVDGEDVERVHDLIARTFAHFPELKTITLYRDDGTQVSIQYDLESRGVQVGE